MCFKRLILKVTIQPNKRNSKLTNENFVKHLQVLVMIEQL